MLNKIIILTLLVFTFASAQNSDELFNASIEKFNILADYESYETNFGREVFDFIQSAKRANESETDDTLQIYRLAVLDGMLGTILLKRNSYITGIARTNDSQRNWERLTNSRFANEANFAIALAEYYRMTFSPFTNTSNSRNTARLNAVIERMRTAVANDNKETQHLALSYIWVLQEQQLWDEAQELSVRFFAEFPDNTMMLRAMQTIAVDRRDAMKIGYYSRKLAELSLNREPINYSDYLSARWAKIFALQLQNDRERACEIARETIEFSRTIPAEARRISWVRTHLEAIEREARRCR